jgi:hypothetical protein
MSAAIERAVARYVLAFVDQIKAGIAARESRYRLLTQATVLAQARNVARARGEPVDPKVDAILGDWPRGDLP